VAGIWAKGVTALLNPSLQLKLELLEYMKLPNDVRRGHMTEVQAELQRFGRDTAYYEAHQKDLLEQYPEQWVAIYNEQVVGASPDADQLFAELKEKGISIGGAFFQYMTDKEEIWILLS
jgi:hypothetical protein